jgi:predicted nucleotidyltransferase
MRTARQLSALLKEQFKAQKVALFGSLIHAQRFTATSDIDLAVWGLPPEHFYAAVAAVTGFSAEFQVDLVEVESCSPTLRQVIEQENIPL